MSTTASRLFFVFVSLLTANLVTAQISISASQTGKGPVRQVAAEFSEGMLAARQMASDGRQIRVSVQYLLVDAETLKSMYRQLDQVPIGHVVDDPRPTADEPLALGQQVSCIRELTSPARASTCLLDASAVATLLETAAASPTSSASSAPSVILLEGKEAQMNDLVQHPFVVDVQQVGETISPQVKAVEEGTRIRLLAGIDDQLPEKSIDLTCEIAVSQLLDVQSDQVFGISDQEPITVQVPLRQVTRAVVSRKVATGLTLLVDPHVTMTDQRESHSGIPVLEKLPVIGSTFQSVDRITIRRHMIVLLKPERE